MLDRITDYFDLKTVMLIKLDAIGQCHQIGKKLHFVNVGDDCKLNIKYRL